MALLVNGQRVAGLGSPGVGIKSIERTGGDGTPGTDDIYTITMTDGKTSEFSVHNGTDGTSGIDGVTPHVGDNGNWFIGDTDTDVRASGQTTTSINTITLAVTGWSGLSQSVACAGILADETKQVITVFPSLTSRDEYMDSGVICTGSGANSLTFTADSAPSTDLLVYVAIEEAGQAPLDVYSTEETVVGTWIDGKPIYRKVFLTTTATVSSGDTVVAQYVDCSPLDVSCPCYLYGTFTNPSSGSYLQIPWFTTGSTARSIKASYRNSDHRIVIEHDSPSWSNAPVTIVFEYTKTTDTATVAIPSATALMDAYEEGVNEA